MRHAISIDPDVLSDCCKSRRENMRPAGKAIDNFFKDCQK